MDTKYNYGSARKDEPYTWTNESFEYMIRSIIELQNMADRTRQDMASIKDDMRNLLDKLDDMTGEAHEEPQNIREMTTDEIKKLILVEVGVDKPFYPSDVAFDYDLDYDAVLEAVESLRREGRIKE